MEPAAREVGRMGPDAVIRGSVLGSKHLQQSQVGVHLQCEPPPRATAGVPQSYGARYPQILRFRYTSHICFFMW